MNAGLRIFHAANRTLSTARTPTGNTEIAREINASFSRHIGAGIEYLENATIEWTVTYDEVLFIHEGVLTIESAGESHECHVADIVFLPSGTALRYKAVERVGYFYALYPVDWAARQGISEP
ncbi:hypothetical protein [Aestuariivirga sp.]|uniref:hypothetical protein n=1 Tax=Aestuariivirga sp. TaxID=2650926 RepID=UPI003BAD8E68